MIQKGKWTVPGYRVSRDLFQDSAALLNNLLTSHFTGEIRRVLSHVNNLTYIRISVYTSGPGSLLYAA
jgi:hypothetical protein